MNEVLLDRSLVAGLEDVPEIVRAAGEAAAQAGLSPDRALHVQLAVEEAAANVCTHAYRGRAGPLRLRVLSDPDALRVEVSDEGTPFDPLAQKPPDLTGDLMQRPVGGVGIHLIRSVTDNLEYERRGDRNILTLIFNLAS